MTFSPSPIVGWAGACGGGSEKSITDKGIASHVAFTPATHSGPEDGLEQPMMMTKTGDRSNRSASRTLLLAAVVLLHAAAASAGIHTWDVREVFSNADGTIQYVELFEAGVNGGETGVGNGSLSSSLHSFSWSNGPVAAPTNGRSYLIATAGFAALPGAPVPDVIIPPANVPFFATTGDTISLSIYDSLAFGAVPTNGLDSFDEIAGVGPNTPKNYAGVTGSVDASAAASVPSVSVMGLLLTVSLILTAGLLGMRRSAISSS